MKRAAVLLALGLAATLLALAAGEALLRAMRFSHPSFWAPDEVVGLRLRPGVEGWWRNEGDVYVRISSQGLRDREHEVAKPASVYRIAVLGDSYAEALQVRTEQTFWWLLAERLERCGFAPGKRIEAVNFGVSGYGTGQELLMLRHKAWAYAPDLVLLAFFPGNDVRNNSRALEGEDTAKPYFRLQEGKLVLDAAFARDPGFREAQRLDAQRAWLQRFRVYQLLRRVRAGGLTVHHNAPIALAIASGGKALPALGEPGLDENVYRDPADAAWREGWAITERLLLAVHEETRQHGARLVVALLSNAGAVHPDAGLRKRYAQYLGVQDLFYPERRLGEFGERHGIPVLALAPELQRRAEAEGIYYHGFPNSRLGFGHWNPQGHAAAAGLIAQSLCPAPAQVSRTAEPASTSPTIGARILRR